jgi:hypothetical protein
VHCQRFSTPSVLILHVLPLRLSDVSISSVHLPVWTVHGFMSVLTTCEACDNSSSASSSTSDTRKCVGISISSLLILLLPPRLKILLSLLRGTTSLSSTLRSLPILLGLLCSLLNDSFSSWSGFFLGLADLASGSAFLLPSEPSDTHLQLCV